MHYRLAILLGIAMVISSAILLLALMLAREPEIPRETLSTNVEIAPPTQAPLEALPEPQEPQAPEPETEPEPEPEPVALPTRVQIEAIGVDHPIIAVGLNADGSMEVPHDVNELGWYEPGVKPGELGSAVIAGHVDSRAQGPGAFFDLRLLDLEDTISITSEDGTTRTWVVERVTRYDKDAIPLGDIFRWDGDSADLVLVTCGGDFDRSLRSYEDNIVIYAQSKDSQ